MNPDPFAPRPTIAPGPRMFSLEGRVALVTGGASGIGRAIAGGFAAFGADVAILDRDGAAAQASAEALARPSGRRVVAIEVDARDEAGIGRAVERVESTLGPVDVLLNAAGHNVRKPLVDLSRDELDGLLQVHVGGAFLTCRAVGRGMRARRRGSIVNIASMVAHVGRADIAAYSAAKGGLLQLSRSFALEMAPYGVRVNAISPGFVDTPLTRTHDPAVRLGVEAASPMGRFADPSELVGAAVFLASDASTFVTGTSIVVDGGWTAQ